MPRDIEELDGRAPRIVIAKNQDKIMEIFDKFPEEEFTQHQLHVQTQIKYPASVHSALMALVRKTKITRKEIESENGSGKTHIFYQKNVE